MLSLILLASIANALQITPDNSVFHYEGRWMVSSEKAKADWPCTSFSFNITVSSKSTIKLAYRNLRTRFQIDITGDAKSTTVVGADLFDLLSLVKHESIDLEAGSYFVYIRKLSQGAPFGTGIGLDLLSASIIEFHGLEIDPDQVKLSAPVPPERRISWYGASDTAGYCVDGNPSMGPIDEGLLGWKYDNCDTASPGVLGRDLKAEISVQAIAGIGLLQNSFAAHKIVMGDLTMAQFYKRTLLSNPALYDFSWAPDLVLISLGGNDFNHQNGHIPTNSTFDQAYETFLLEIFDHHGSTTIVSVCGQGDPNEAKLDPDNNRCRPCPNVEAANIAFKSKYPLLKMDYIYIPCDGSVVTGKDDIGCAGHKNVKGQSEVAEYLAPKLREIMGWDN